MLQSKNETRENNQREGYAPLHRRCRNQLLAFPIVLALKTVDPLVSSAYLYIPTRILPVDCPIELELRSADGEMSECKAQAKY